MEHQKNEIFIVYEYNDRDITGLDKFKEELSQSYLCQGRSKQMSAFSEGGEVWINVFINIPFVSFAQCAVTGGLRWNMVKTDTHTYHLKPLLDAIRNLEKANKDMFELRVEAIKFVFDDIEILMGGMNSPLFSALGSVFSQVSQRKPAIEKLLGLPIVRIETPILTMYNPLVSQREYFPYVINNRLDLQEKDFLDVWKIYTTKDYQVYRLIDNLLVDMQVF